MMASIVEHSSLREHFNRRIPGSVVWLCCPVFITYKPAWNGLISCVVQTKTTDASLGHPRDRLHIVVLVPVYNLLIPFFSSQCDPSQGASRVALAFFPSWGLSGHTILPPRSRLFPASALWINGLVPKNADLRRRKLTFMSEHQHRLIAGCSTRGGRLGIRLALRRGTCWALLRPPDGTSVIRAVLDGPGPFKPLIQTPSFPNLIDGHVSQILFSPGFFCSCLLAVGCTCSRNISGHQQARLRHGRKSHTSR